MESLSSSSRARKAGEHTPLCPPHYWLIDPDDHPLFVQEKTVAGIEFVRQDKATCGKCGAMTVFTNGRRAGTGKMVVVLGTTERDVRVI